MRAVAGRPGPRPPRATAPRRWAAPARRRWILTAACLALTAAPLASEALSPPPIRVDPWVAADSRSDEAVQPAGAAPAPSFFPAVHAWLGLERYSFQTGHPLFAWDFDLGAHILLYEHERFAVSGLGRLLYQNRGVEGTRFGIDPTAILTDLHLRVRAKGLPVTPTVWYRHDCKHDIASAPRRDTIHDALGLSFSDHRQWGGTSGRWRGGFTYRVTAEYDLPLIFQDYEANANVASFHLALRPELVFGTGRRGAGQGTVPRAEASRVVLFTEVRGSLLVDDPTSEFATAGDTRLDWLARVGMTWPDDSRGATLYAQWERITDPWRLAVSESQPATLFSIGLVLSGTGHTR